MQYTIYSEVLKKRYKNISQHDLVGALKSIFSKFRTGMSYEKFYDLYGGYQAYENYNFPENLSMFDVLANTLIIEFKVPEKMFYDIFDGYFQMQDEIIKNNISELIAEYMPYYQTNSPLLEIAQKELSSVRKEYNARISEVLKNRVNLFYFLLDMQVKNILRSQYYDIIKKHFKNEVIDLTNSLKNKYTQNVEYIALEILMQILIQDFGTQKPFK